MADFGMSVHVDIPLDEALERTRAALAAEGFGILTEIDVAATLKAKLDVEVPPQVILGACNAPLARQGLAIEPDLGLLLPCNVVVRTRENEQVLVSAQFGADGDCARPARARADRGRRQHPTAERAARGRQPRHLIGRPQSA